jgi:hypothetical protein
MDRTASLRLLVAAGSVLLALARIAPADIVATTLTSATPAKSGGAILVAELTQNWTATR